MSNYKKSTRDPKDSEASLPMWSIIALTKWNFDMKQYQSKYIKTNRFKNVNYEYEHWNVFIFTMRYTLSWTTFSWGTCQSCLKLDLLSRDLERVIQHITRRSCLTVYKASMSLFECHPSAVKMKTENNEIWDRYLHIRQAHYKSSQSLAFQLQSHETISPKGCMDYIIRTPWCDIWEANHSS